VHSVLNSHIQVWSRYNLEVPHYIPIHMPDMMHVPRVFVDQPKDLCLIPRNLFWAVVTYGKAMGKKTVDKEMLVGKIRMMNLNENDIPVGDLDWIVAVMNACIKWEISSEDLTRDYKTFMGMLDYKIRKRFLGKWRKWTGATGRVERMRKIVSGDRRVVTIPTIVMKLDGFGGEYGVSWHIDPDSKASFWQACRRFFADTFDCGMDRVDQVVTLGKDGVLRANNAIFYNRRNMRWLKPSEIKDTQRRAFRQAWEPNLLPPLKPKPGTQRAPDVLSITSTETDSDATLVGSGIDDWKKEKKFDGAEWEDDCLPHGIDEVIQCCPYGPIKQAHENTLLYFRLCDRRHAAECEVVEPPPGDSKTHKRKTYSTLRMEVNKQQERLDASPRSLYKQRSREFSSSTSTLTSVDSSVASSYSEDVKVPPDKPKKVKDPDKLVQKTIDTQLRRMIELSEAIDAHQNSPALPRRRCEGIPFKMPKTTTWDEREADFIKLMSKGPWPALGGAIRTLAGPQLWDSLYPKTTGVRIDKAPFKPMIYPKRSYPKQDCLVVALATVSRLPTETVFLAMLRAFPHDCLKTDDLTTDCITPFALANNLQIKVFSKPTKSKAAFLMTVHGVRGNASLSIEYSDHHFTALEQKLPLTIRELGPIPEVSREAKWLIGKLRENPMITWINIQPSAEIGRMAVRCMIQGELDLIGSNHLNHSILKGWEESLKNMKLPNLDLGLICGDPGCGKTSGIMESLRDYRAHSGRAFSIALGKNGLREMWATKLGVKDKKGPLRQSSPNYMCTTTSKAMAEGHWGWVMASDEAMYFPGWHALKAAMFPHVKTHLFLFDPHQCTWHNPKECTLNNANIPKEEAMYGARCKTFITGSLRFDEGVGNFFNLPVFKKLGGGFHYTTKRVETEADMRIFFPNKSEEWIAHAWENKVLAVASDVRKRVKLSVEQQDADTFVGTQGYDEDVCIVELTDEAMRVDARTLYVLGTRAPHIIWCCLFNQTYESTLAVADNIVLKEIMHYAPYYIPGEPVRIVKEHSVNIKSLLKILPPDTRYVLAAKPEYCVNRKFVEAEYPESLWTDFLPRDIVQRGGHTMLSRDDPAYQDPKANLFLPHMTLVPAVHVPEVEIPDPSIPMPRLATTVPPENPEVLNEHLLSQRKERFTVELESRGEYTDQKPDLYIPRYDAGIIVGKLKAELRKDAVARYPATAFNARKKATMEATRKLQSMLKGKGKDNPTLFLPKWLNLANHHRTKDAPLYRTGMDQRIRKQTHAENYVEYANQLEFGDECFRALKRYMNWSDNPIGLDQSLFEQSVQLFDESRAERSQALKLSSLNRADTDFRPTVVIKQQDKLKVAGKAPQTIQIRGDKELFALGPWGRYLASQIVRHCPKHVFINMKKTYQEMSDWVMLNDPGGFYYASDGTAYEQSVQGWGVRVTESLLHYFGAPQEVVELYQKSKLENTVNGKEIGTSTMSGEIFTFLTNTMTRIARKAFQLNLSSKDPGMWGGDDLLLFSKPPENPQFALFAEYDTLEEKDEFSTDHGTFCSYLIKRAVIKDPLILYTNFMKMVEMGKVEEAVVGYAPGFATVYNTREVLYSILNEEQMMAHSVLTRIYFNLRKFMRTNVGLAWEQFRVDSIELDGWLEPHELKSPEFESVLVENEAGDPTYYEPVPITEEYHVEDHFDYDDHEALRGGSTPADGRIQQIMAQESVIKDIPSPGLPVFEAVPLGSEAIFNVTWEDNTTKDVNVIGSINEILGDSVFKFARLTLDKIQVKVNFSASSEKVYAGWSPVGSGLSTTQVAGRMNGLRTGGNSLKLNEEHKWDFEVPGVFSKMVHPTVDFLAIPRFHLFVTKGAQVSMIIMCRQYGPVTEDLVIGAPSGVK